MKIFLYSLIFLSAAAPLNGVHQFQEKKDKKDVILVVPIEERLSFAKQLEDEQDYYRAITEYKRQMYKHTDNATLRKCLVAVARCYYKGHKWLALDEACIKALEIPGHNQVTIQALQKARALALWNLGETGKAYQVVSKIDDEELNTAQLKAWTATALGKKDEAEKSFMNAKQPHMAAFIKKQIHEKKSPAIAGTLSALLPGAGQLYTGNYSAAAGAFFVNALLIASSIEAFDEDQEALGTGLGLLALTFYSGNIYGAINFAHQHNDQSLDDILARRSDMVGKYRESVIMKIEIPF